MGQRSASGRPLPSIATLAGTSGREIANDATGINQAGQIRCPSPREYAFWLQIGIASTF